MSEFGALGIVSIVSPSSELGIVHCFFFLIPYSSKIILSNFQFFSQLGQQVGNRFSRIIVPACIEPKYYLVQAHKLQISPRHGVGPVMGHFLG